MYSLIMKKKKRSLAVCVFLLFASFFLLAFDGKTPFVWPLRGPVITSFMERYEDVQSCKTRTHTGIDIQGETSQKVLASGNGFVSYIGISPIGGRTVVIRHNERIKSNYLNLAEIYVKKGQFVRQGMPIGCIGAKDDPSSDTVHLHFAIVYQGAYLDPEDVLKIDYSSISEYINLAYMPLDFHFSY